MKNIRISKKVSLVLVVTTLLTVIAIYALFIRPWKDTDEVSFLCEKEPQTLGCEYRHNSKTLVVLLHAFSSDQSQYDGVVSTIKSHPEFEKAEFLRPNLPFKLMSLATPESVLNALMSKIDERWQINKHEKIVFVGHSMGALFARKLLILANGKKCLSSERPETGLDTNIQNCMHSETRPWAKHIDRIILLAGMNNGWSISHHMGFITALKLQIGDFLGDTIEKLRDKTPIVMHIKSGSKFISELRFDWVAMQEKLSLKSPTNNTGKRSRPLIVQLLGTQDDLVPPTDNIDPISGRDFSYLEIGFSNHVTVREMDLPKPNRVGESGDQEIRQYCANLIDGTKLDGTENDILEKAKQLRACVLLEALSYENIDSKENVEPDKVTDVVFVIHGIRDLGFWTEKISNRIKQKASIKNRKFVTIHSSYGYFPILSFLRPNEREEKVQWFVDQYTLAKAKYPKANFHFVGHSHGTYLLARSIEKYDAIKFKNVVFAGSVVQQDYDWGTRLQNKDVARVLNFTATFDWVVAWFPNAIEMLNWQDLGSAGHDGFNNLPANIFQVENITGGHSAALNELNWDAIANFILLPESWESNSCVEGDIECIIDVPKALKGNDKFWLFNLSGHLAFFIWVLIGIVLFYIYRFVIKSNVEEWQKTVYLIGLSYSLWLVITRI